MLHCDLETGALLFYERFEGVDRSKDRYFVVLANASPIVFCFTTTTQPHCETRPKLATEFCTIEKGECCLPKRCFVDFRHLQEFGDIELGSRLRARSVKPGHLPDGILRRIRSGVHGCRSLTPALWIQTLLVPEAEPGTLSKNRLGSRFDQASQNLTGQRTGPLRSRLIKQVDIK